MIASSLDEHALTVALISISASAGGPWPIRCRHRRRLDPARCPRPYLPSITSLPPPGRPGAVLHAFSPDSKTLAVVLIGSNSVTFCVDISRDFVEMMIPPHQGAIEMAQTCLRRGSDERLKRIAQEIIVEQVREIATMHLVLGDPLPASSAEPMQVGSVSASVVSHKP